MMLAKYCASVRAPLCKTRGLPVHPWLPRPHTLLLDVAIHDIADIAVAIALSRVNDPAHLIESLAHTSASV